MACHVELDNRSGYLHVLVTGDNSAETIRTYSDAVREACQRLQKLKVLVVVNLTGPEVPLRDVYDSVAAGSDQAAGLGMRVAYVDANPAHSIDAMLLAEDVASSRGIPVRTFRDEREAEVWLLS